MAMHAIGRMASENKMRGGKDWFLLSAGVILMITGLAKVISSFGQSGILGFVDPIFGIDFRWLMLLAGFLELLISASCLLASKRTAPFYFIAWLATSLLAYRVGLWLLDWHIPCHCLGNLTDALLISPQIADWVMKMVLAYLLLGSYFMLFRMQAKAGKLS